MTRSGGQLLPEVQSIMEHVEGNPEILERLSILAAGLVDAESRLENRPQASKTETFDIARDDAENRKSGGAEGAAVDRDGPQGKGGAGQGNGKGKSAEWRPEGPGRWTRAAAAGKAGNAAGAAVQPASSPGTGAQDKKRPGGDGDSAETTGTGAGSDGLDTHMDDDTRESDGEQGKPPKHRRRRTAEEAKLAAREAADKQRAEELRRQQDAAAAAQVDSYNAGAGGASGLRQRYRAPHRNLCSRSSGHRNARPGRVLNRRPTMAGRSLRSHPWSFRSGWRRNWVTMMSTRMI